MTVFGHRLASMVIARFSSVIARAGGRSRAKVLQNKANNNF
jgi:hypothetical protein